ncbi:unnamed protein product [Ixodes pacificus]
MELDNFQPEIRVQRRCSPRLCNSKILWESLRRRVARSLPGGHALFAASWRTARFFRPCTGLRRKSTCPGTGKAPAASRIARPASSRHDASPPFARKNRAGKAAGWHRPRRRNSEALAGRPLSPSLRPRPAKAGARLPNASPFTPKQY